MIVRVRLLVVALALLAPPTLAAAIPPAAAHAPARVAAPAPDAGQHDFDFEWGRWTIDVRRLVHPLSGTHTWLHPTGFIHIVRPVWDGRASLAELELDHPTPHFLGSLLHLYDPRTHLWKIYWASSKDGSVDPPLIGRFTNGRGEFHGHDTLNGKPIAVRLIYSAITPTSFRTEQAFSANGGKTWETNLIQTFTRLSR